MDSILELYSVLSKGEKKLISARLKKSGKNLLLDYYKSLTNNTKERNTTNNPLKKATQTTVKNQLYNYILDTIANHSVNQSLDRKIRNSLNQIETLKDKFLYIQALKKIRTLKPILENHERFNYLHELILMEMEIKYRQESAFNFKTSLSEMEEDFNKNNLFGQQYFTQKIGFYTIMAKNHLETSEEEDIIDKMEEKNPSNKFAYYFNAKTEIVAAFRRRDYNKAKLQADILLELLEELSYDIENRPEHIIDVNYMSALAYLLVRDLKNYWQCLESMSAVTEKNPILKDRDDERRLYLEWTRMVLYEVPLDEALFVIDNKMERLAYFGIDFFNRILEQISTYFIKKGNYIEANKWNRKILHLTDKKKVYEFSSRAEFRNIFIHFQKGRIDSMENAIKRLLGTNQYSLKEKNVNTLSAISKSPSEHINKLLPLIGFWD